MKIKFKIPEWAIGKHIHILAGSELLAYKECKVVHKNGEHIIEYLPLKIKPEEGRCNGCGVCCKDGSFPQRLLVKMKEALKKRTEHCHFLGEDGCILGAFIPFSCIRSICSHYENCSERLE